MSQPAPSKQPSKTPSTSSQAPSGPSITQQYFSSGETRRSSLTRQISSNSTPRNAQTSKPKHKSSKRFKALPDDDDTAETFSMQNPHGRRGQQSITHLMQFALPPRPTSSSYSRGVSQNVKRKTWGMGSGYHAVDKARYINANYRFIVSPQGHYHEQAKDADVHLDWNDVLQVVASSKTQNSSCPICLGEPTAPRMAKCGHIFCLPCLIRYMHSDEPATTSSTQEKKARWKKCPICWDSIYISETRPVRWYAGSENDPPREDGDVVLRLVKRKADSTLAMPRESADPLLNGEDIPWYFAAEVMDYARIMKGSEDYMMEQYDEAIAAVEQMEREDELMFGEDTEWTGRAKRMLREAKDKVKGIGCAPAYLQRPVPAVPQPVVERWDEEDIKQDDTIPRTLSEMRQRQFEKPLPLEYLFYHAIQHYYLSPLDIRILKAAFGSYNNFPSSILPRVDRVSAGHVVDDELRKRVKYLSHLPHGCEVGFLECDWTDTVPASVLAEFDTQIKKRRSRNQEKEAREEKDRIRIQKDEEKEFAALRRTRRPSVSFTSFSAEQLPTLSESMTDGSAPLATSPPWPRRANTGFTSLASPSTSPSAHRTVWGTAAIAPSSPEANATLPSDADFTHEGDGWLQDWEKDLLSDHDLAAQVEALEITAKPVIGKKGKKNKKITLMSTGNNRRGA
ncbi:hypothetical protein AMS68_003867 [Peltaster fructicola]|uniref:RING-type domain-containing protein n=1 Tax=Peltaster fructicola TaxID=286661 RepID=A0A6H0XV77_9PEZI|nr:hypothetical protein AMS68_003867 [Peltaster fructicola]